MGLSVGFSAVEDAIDGDGFSVIIDRQQHAIIPHAHTIAITSGKFLNLRTTRLDGQQLNPLEDQAPDRMGKRPQIFFNATIVEEIVHRLEEPLALQSTEKLPMRNGAAAGTDGLLEELCIGDIFNEMYQLSVVHQGEHDRRGFPALVDQELIGCDLDSHCDASVSRGLRRVKDRRGRVSA